MKKQTWTNKTRKNVKLRKLLDKKVLNKQTGSMKTEST